MSDFVKLQEDLGHWDIERINADLKNLFITHGYDWDQWKGFGRVVRNNIQYQGRGTDMNLTSNMQLCPTVHDRLWKYSGRYLSEANIPHSDLTTIIPEIYGSYLCDMIENLQKKFGQIRVRLHNRTNNVGLYWHIDKNSGNRYHLALWTNPGHFMVWTDQFTKWYDGFDPNECNKSMTYNAEFIPADGKWRLLATHDFLHGVASIGVGFKQPVNELGRCHLVFQPIS